MYWFIKGQNKADDESVTIQSVLGEVAGEQNIRSEDHC